MHNAKQKIFALKLFKFSYSRQKISTEVMDPVELDTNERNNFEDKYYVKIALVKKISYFQMPSA